MYDRAEKIFDGLPGGGTDDPRVGAVMNQQAIELFEQVSTDEGLLRIWRFAWRTSFRLGDINSLGGPQIVNLVYSVPIHGAIIITL